MVTQNMFATNEEKIGLFEENIRFSTALDLIKCLIRSNNRNFFFYRTYSELSYITITILRAVNYRNSVAV